MRPRPHRQRRRLSEQRHADDFDHVVERIELHEHLAAAQRARQPEDRRQKERDLQDAADDRRNVAKSRAERAEHQRGGKPASSRRNRPGNAEKKFQPRSIGTNSSTRDRYHVVREDQEIAPQHLKHVDAERRLELQDQRRRTDEDVAPSVAMRGDQVEDDHARSPHRADSLQCSVRTGRHRDRRARRP